MTSKKFGGDGNINRTPFKIEFLSARQVLSAAAVCYTPVFLYLLEDDLFAD